MTATSTGLHFSGVKKWFVYAVIATMTFMALTILLDKFESVFKNTGFYLSESFLFSSVWWLAAPLLLAQYFAVQLRTNHSTLLLIILLPVGLHLLLYPSLIWILSAWFFDHTFRFSQTFNFALTTYLLKFIMLYTAPIGLYIFFKNKLPSFNQTVKPLHQQSLQSLIVTQANKQVLIKIADIHYISANYPYSNLHHKDGKFLYNSTLKSINNQLDPEKFVRIHKSAIVNLEHLQSFQSRHNGDYDIVMTDGTTLRVSRNYATAFKAMLKQYQQLTK